MIPVTKSFLPNLSEYTEILKGPWQDGLITNRGKLVKELEIRIQAYLQSNSLIAMTNGTLPLQIALKVMSVTGEVITTPFSYIATSSSIVWEGCRPVFVDINPDFLTIDESKIVEAITKKTSAILVTHVFGNPCDVERIEEIAKEYNLKVIYDAAHCFGVTYKDKSIFNYGDISTCSFHATKLFHTGEGGAAFCNDKSFYDKLFYHHNFGHNGQEAFHGLGINAKMSELQAAMGLSVLPYIEEIIESRGGLVQQYLKTLNFQRFRFFQLRKGTKWNNSYFPIIFDTEELLNSAIIELNKVGVFPRRYFFPSLNTIPYLTGGLMPISESISSRIICLPIYYGLSEIDVSRICKLLNEM